MIKLLHRICHFIQRLILQIRMFPIYYRNFGFKMAFIIILDRLFPPGRSKLYRNAVYEYLYFDLQAIIANYNNGPIKTIAQSEKTEQFIWVCWFQGEENMPELVNLCFKNLKKMVADPDIQITLLTHDNISRYVDIPQFILDKHHKGEITNAHLSDILRIKLLRKYGGCWIDSTVFITRPITKNLFANTFYTLKMRPELCPLEPCMGLWSGFFLVSQKDNILFRILDDCLDLYWKNHNIIIDYVIIDYLMLIAYRNNAEVKKEIDAVPYNNEELWYLWDNLEQLFETDLYDRICTKGQFYKLAHQKKISKTSEGKQTVYGYLLAQ